ncbi:prohibitin family protein [Synechococcus sp. CCY9201]|uniref:prohibitin family protein n=1 Tax=unclassified Synechococcus TaxID=2626047 RepID=UPI0018CD127A|nr:MULTISPECIES: prohibitin family protein [unclassified Synechococcus]MEA5422063.1 prohibitin family protein [Synechococcus sp. CCY9202]MEA5472620.1 prohibitin family protein [Synechococcus sp. CCY9201]QPN60675.1 prohibitin family protein [Synechococcus sp. CBW1002]QPN67626.1 prohibitin family protein [Synechococcus sp. CBW1006]
MQGSMRPAGGDGFGTALQLVVAGIVALLILLSQTIFIVPAGNVAVVTTLGRVTGGERRPGPNLKIPLIQATSFFDVRTQVRPEQFSTLTKDLQVIEATATMKYAIRPSEAGRVFETIATDNQQIYPRVIQPSLLKALKSVFSQYELVTIATEWNSISELVQDKVAEELKKFDYVTVQGLDLTGLQIAEEYRAAIEQKQIADQRLLRSQTEVKIAEQEALRYEILNKSLDDQVLYKLFLDKWDGQTSVVPALPGASGGTPPVIVQGRR